MKKILFILLALVVYGSAQIPVFYYGGKAHDGQACIVKTFSSSDTSFTSETIYWESPYKLFTGAVTLGGAMQLISGTDTVTTIQARLVIRKSSALTGESASTVYDSTGWHTVAQNTGDYIPAENDVTTNATSFAVDLVAQDWWKPSIGIEIRFIQNTMHGSGTKELEAYLIPQRYNY